MAYRIEPRNWELDRWYRLSWLQVGDRVRGAIDGRVVVDFTDSGFDNNGPVLRHGRIALRTMMRTDLTFRHLRVMARPEIETVSDHKMGRCCCLPLDKKYLDKYNKSVNYEVCFHI